MTVGGSLLKIILFVLVVLPNAARGLDLVIKPGLVRSHYSVSFINERILQYSTSLTCLLEQAYNQAIVGQIFYQPLVSASGRELSRHSYGIGVYYVLAGSSRIVRSDSLSVTAEYRGRWALFVPLLMSYNFYQVQLEDRPGKLKGNIVQFYSGLGFRWDLHRSYSLLAETNLTILSLADGDGRTTATDQSVSLGWQTSL